MRSTIAKIGSHFETAKRTLLKHVKGFEKQNVSGCIVCYTGDTEQYGFGRKTAVFFVFRSTGRMEHDVGNKARYQHEILGVKSRVMILLARIIFRYEMICKKKVLYYHL